MKKLVSTTLLVILLLSASSVWAVQTVAVNPDLPDTLDADQISRMALFPDLSQVVSVWFERASWGSIIAHLTTRDGHLEKHLERTMPRQRWLEMQERGVALVSGLPIITDPNQTGEDLARERDFPQTVKAWPEVPARNRELSEEMLADSGPRYPSLAGQWLVSGGLGYQHNVSSFDAYFTDMAVFQLGFAHALTENIIPCAGFTAGFGDLKSDFEDLVGDGHGSNYSAMAGLLLRAPVSLRTSLYVGGQGGYFRRSLQWGGVFMDPATGKSVQGYARESGNWGFAVQVGLMRQKSHSRKARFFDFSVGVMWAEAEKWDDIGDDVRFTAEGDDAWLMFTFRFWDQIQ